MPRVNVDGLPNAPEAGEPVPEGWHTVQVQGCEIETARDEQSKYVAWRSEVLEGEHEGRAIFWNTSCKEGGKPFMKSCLVAADVPFDEDGWDTEDAVGSILQVLVNHREYEGRTQADVQDWRPAD